MWRILGTPRTINIAQTFIILLRWYKSDDNQRQSVQSNDGFQICDSSWSIVFFLILVQNIAIKTYLSRWKCCPY